jgi:hypothetical protein
MENNWEEYIQKVDPILRTGDKLDNIINGIVICFVDELSQINNISIKTIPLTNIKKEIKSLIIEQLEQAFIVQDNVAQLDAESKRKRRYYINSIPNIKFNKEKQNPSSIMEFFDDTITPI